MRDVCRGGFKYNYKYNYKMYWVVDCRMCWGKLQGHNVLPEGKEEKKRQKDKRERDRGILIE